MRYAKRRDENEDDVVAALEHAGASVAKLNDASLPDLLVSYDNVLHLIEVKRVAAGRKVHVGKGGDDRGLTPAQSRWWARWNGRPPVIVQTAAEALAAIGAGK